MNLEFEMITANEAIAIARNYVAEHLPDCVEDTPTVRRFPAEHRRDPPSDLDAWQVIFPWKETEGLDRSSRCCWVLIDMHSGAVVK